jgi:hypothetical protein
LPQTPIFIWKPRRSKNEKRRRVYSVGGRRRRWPKFCVVRGFFFIFFFCFLFFLFLFFLSLFELLYFCFCSYCLYNDGAQRDVDHLEPICLIGSKKRRKKEEEKRQTRQIFPYCALCPWWGETEGWGSNFKHLFSRKLFSFLFFFFLSFFVLAQDAWAQRQDVAAGRRAYA